mmetsp:Transcript_13469/g.27547  ORF Transcript_13469/g.27547 Transcript_13469/m.27547 type:complete len:472 (-) Transcript_13469:15-1430(-)
MADLPANPLLYDDQAPQPPQEDLPVDHVVSAPSCPLASPPPVEERACSNPGCARPGDTNKRCGKCLVSCYCSRECQVAHWKSHKAQCRLNRSFELSAATEEHLLCLNLDFERYFLDHFGGDERGYRRYKSHFDKLGDIGSTQGRSIGGITIGVLEVLRSGDRQKLEALEKLCEERCFDDPALTLETRKSLMEILEKEYEAGEVTEEELLDGVLALGRAHNLTMDGLCPAFFERAREGYNRLLGPDHEKTLEAEYSVTSQLRSEKEQVKLYKNLLNRTLRILGDHELTFDTANELGIKMKNKNDLEASMKYYDIALKGQLRLMGEEHQKTLRTLNNVGLLYHNMENWEKSLEFNRRALKGKEKVLGRTHPSTCTTLMNIANTYVDGLKDYANAEKMYRMALDGREKSFGKGHQDTKDCAKNLARLLFMMDDVKKLKELTKIENYPHLLREPDGIGDVLTRMIKKYNDENGFS